MVSRRELPHRAGGVNAFSQLGFYDLGNAGDKTQ